MPQGTIRWYGKLFDSDRLAEQTISVKGKQIDAWYSGKAHEQGGNIEALSAPDGFPLWVADVEPGSTHDLTAARAHVLAALYWAASQLKLPTLAMFVGTEARPLSSGLGTAAPRSWLRATPSRGRPCASRRGCP